MNGSGVNEAKLAKAAVAAAAATVEHTTIMIPALQHRRNVSAFNWNRGQSCDKSLNNLSANDAQKKCPANWETSVGFGEKADMQDGYQLVSSLRRI